MPTPLPTIAGVYYGYVWMTLEGRKCGSTFSFLDASPESDPANDAAKADYIAAGLTSSWNTNMLPRYPSTVSGTDAKVYPLGHPSLPAALSHATGTGAGGTSLAPASAAAVIRHVVERRGRGSQGHTQISPLLVGETDLTGDNVTDAFVTNVTADFEDFIAGVQSAFTTATGGDTISYVLLSKKHSLVSPILSSHVEKLLGTERSRTLRP